MSTPVITNKSELASAITSFLTGNSGYLPMNDWDVSKVTDMSELFGDNQYFNEPIWKWNTSEVTNMSAMFFGASTFDQDISGWNTSNVTDMTSMFRDAIAFNQDIRVWNTLNVSFFTNMLKGSGLLNNYGFTLETPFQSNFNFKAPRKYIGFLKKPISTDISRMWKPSNELNSPFNKVMFKKEGPSDSSDYIKFKRMQQRVLEKKSRPY